VKNLNFLSSIILVTVILFGLALPVFAVDYTPGVTVGQYIKYGNFSGNGQGFEAFNDYGFLKLQVTSVSGKQVTLLSTGQFKNGTSLPGNGTSSIWNIETGTEDGIPSTQGPIIAANLNQHDTIPPPDTFSVNQSESRTYLGTIRTVNILAVEINTSDYNSTLTYVYDKLSGLLIESFTQTMTQSEPQPVASSYSYSITETNIFGSTPNPSSTVPEFPILTLEIVVVVLMVVTLALILIKRKK
jgi:hypothetical protein